MIVIEREPKRQRFILQPNRSISWRQLKLVFAGLCTFSLTNALVMTGLGFWPVLPFAGIELLAVGCALYVVARRCRRREVISIDADRVHIERGHDRPESNWNLARYWARVVVERPRKRWYASRLLIRAQGCAVEVGSFLTEHERHRLATELSRNLGRVS